MRVDKRTLKRLIVTIALLIIGFKVGVLYTIYNVKITDIENNLITLEIDNQNWCYYFDTQENN